MLLCYQTVLGSVILYYFIMLDFAWTIFFLMKLEISIWSNKDKRPVSFCCSTLMLAMNQVHPELQKTTSFQGCSKSRAAVLTL